MFGFNCGLHFSFNSGFFLGFDFGLFFSFGTGFFFSFGLELGPNFGSDFVFGFGFVKNCFREDNTAIESRVRADCHPAGDKQKFFVVGQAYLSFRVVPGISNKGIGLYKMTVFFQSFTKDPVPGSDQHITDFFYGISHAVNIRNCAAFNVLEYISLRQHNNDAGEDKQSFLVEYQLKSSVQGPFSFYRVKGY